MNHISANAQSKNTWPHDSENIHENHGPILIQPAYKKQDKTYSNKDLLENESTFVAEKLEQDGPKVLALVMEQDTKVRDNSTSGKKKLIYKSMSGIRLKKPVRLQMWLDIDKETFGSRTNPQCVHWSTLRG